MAEIGYWLSSEEHSPSDLVRFAQQAEELGFKSAMISDHFHPWIDKQGQAPFVWSVLGGIAATTRQLTIGTGVTCPIIRYNPAVLAQAVATVAAMMPGRFFLGVGAGENLNEHVVGDRWPTVEERHEMLEEAVQVMRQLWQGGLQSHRGKYYTVDNARIYSLPDKPVAVAVAAAGPKAAELAGRIGDALVGTEPSAGTVKAFDAAGGKGKPRHGQFSFCWGETKEQAVQTAYEIWPTSGLKGPLNTELALPSYFEQAAAMVTKEDIEQAVVCGPDPQPILEKIRKFEEAGYDHIYLHQIGHDQEGFFRFYKRELQPRMRSH